MIARESLEKSLPRLASAAPFLCLIDDHLLWPAIGASVHARRAMRISPLGAHEVEEARVHAQVVRELRVESRQQEAAIAYENGLLPELAHDLDARAELANARRADEDAMERDLVARELDVGLEAPHLAPVRVPVHLEIGEPEMLAVEHDHPRAGPEDGRLELPDRLVEPVELGELDDGRRLAARDDETVDPLEILRFEELG